MGTARPTQHSTSLPSSRSTTPADLPLHCAKTPQKAISIPEIIRCAKRSLAARGIPKAADRLLRSGADLIDRATEGWPSADTVLARLSETRPPPRLTNLSLAGTAQVDRGHVPQKGNRV